MITNVSRREDDKLTWKDIEMLPLYGGAVLLGFVVVQGLSHLTPALHGATVKAAVVLGLVGLQQWLGVNVGSSD